MMLSLDETRKELRDNADGVVLYGKETDIEKNGADKSSFTMQEPVLIFGTSIDHLPRTAKFVVCSGGVFFFYILYGYFQELIFSLDGFKPFGWYLTLVQFFFYTVFSITERRVLLKDNKRRIPLATYGILALLTVGTMGFSNTSLGYLNYPTQVIFKCCKLIPVMIGGILIQGKKYTLVDFIACCLMSMGLIIFTLADSKVSPEFNYTGVLLISLALCADAGIGNVQEKAMKAYHAVNAEVVLYSYGIGFFYILFALLATTGIMNAFLFCAKHPLQTYGYAFMFSLTGYLGITFVLTLIRTFGALTTVTVTMFRKAVTIVLSFLIFSKPFTLQYLFGGLVVLLGLVLNTAQKNKVDFHSFFVRMKIWMGSRSKFFTKRTKSLQEV